LRGLLERIHVGAQIALLAGIFLGCDRLAEALGAPIPGNVLGILVLFLLLSFRVLRLEWVAEGADFLLAHLSLFFVPAVVSVIALVGPLRSSLLGVAVVMVSTTMVVMLATGWTAERLATPEKTPEER
jgi:holin-like protein